MPPRLLVAAVCAAFGAMPAVAAAQHGLHVRGGVVTEGGDRLPHALVVLRAPERRRFADETGVFTFTDVAPGTYTLEVRQVGYRPWDSTITVGAVHVQLRVQLERVAVQLAAITVSALTRCERPGPPDPARNPELSVIFAQLRFNAERYAFLADSFPHISYMRRRLTDTGADGALRMTIEDSTDYRSDVRWHYRPGQVIGTGTGPGGRRARVVNLPTLPSLADSVFHATHCFRFGGVVAHEGARAVVLEFRAAEALRQPDVDGEALLDPDTYQVRRITIRVTRIRRAMPGVDSLVASATFRELYPHVIVPALVTGVTYTTRAGRRGAGTTEQTEIQRLTRVRFLRPLISER